MRMPGRWTIADVGAYLRAPKKFVKVRGEMWPVRPKGLIGFRARLACAWEVFRGRADVLVWPGQER